jgi:hypothetical protein
MWSHRKARSPGVDPEALLRAHRAEPRKEFVDGLSRRLGTRGERPTAWSRLAFAGAASTLILGMFAAVGGMSYATAGASATYSAVKRIVVEKKVQVPVDKSSAQAQYPGTPTPPAQPPSQPTSPPEQNVAGAETQSQAVAAAETLPFTGISLLVAVLLGSSLLVLGLILRRRERRSS